MLLIIGTVYPLKTDCCNENIKVFKNLPAITEDLLQAQ